MTQTYQGRPYDDRGALDPAFRPELYDGVLSKRIIAFLIDAVLIVLLMIPAALLVAVLGIFTLGLAWLLYPALFAIVALGYVAFTLGGPASATPGMRIIGVEMRTGDGRAMFPLLAAAHALLFWVSWAFPPILLVGLLTRRRQLLHDLILDTVLVNSTFLRRPAP